MKYFSLFSGVGGFEIGIEKAYVDVSNAARKEPDPLDLAGGDAAHHQEPMGMEQPHPVCVGFSEIDKHASAVLKYRFPNVKNYGDIQKIRWDRVPDFDLLVGGSPCQDLSIAGKRAGLEGGRSGLFYEYVRTLEEKKPEHFIWENVKGALSSNGGRDFGAVLSALAEAGYSLWWQILNAKDFGVPQNRERIFVVGTRNGSPREVFFERNDDQVHPESTEAQKEVYDVASTQTARQYASWGGNYAVSQSARLTNTNRPNPTLQANGGGGGAKTGLILHQNQSGTVTPHEISVAQGANRSHNYQTLLQNARIRRLTPKECERLMSWPDDWTKLGDYGEGPKEISDTQRYKMCGNGVVSAVVCEVVKAHLLTRKEE